MRKSIVTIMPFFLVLLMGFSSQGASFERELREARQLLDKGDAEAAIGLLKEAQVDNPNASELLFGIACALYLKAEKLLESGNIEESQAVFTEAQSQFSALAQDPNEKLAREAVFNHANTLARQALGVAGAGDFSAAVGSLRAAIEAYEAGLARFPDHTGMQQNLDHIQLKLKEMLQNPPPEQEQPKEQPPSDTPPAEISRFGQAATDLPGAQTRVEENMAVLVPPEKQETQP